MSFTLRNYNSAVYNTCDPKVNINDDDNDCYIRSFQMVDNIILAELSCWVLVAMGFEHLSKNSSGTKDGRKKYRCSFFLFFSACLPIQYTCEKDLTVEAWMGDYIVRLWLFPLSVVMG